MLTFLILLGFQTHTSDTQNVGNKNKDYQPMILDLELCKKFNLRQFHAIAVPIVGKKIDTSTISICTYDLTSGNSKWDFLW